MCIMYDLIFTMEIHRLKFPSPVAGRSWTRVWPSKRSMGSGEGHTFLESGGVAGPPAAPPRPLGCRASRVMGFISPQVIIDFSQGREMIMSWPGPAVTVRKIIMT